MNTQKRSVLNIYGKDSESFLQNLLTNDVTKATEKNLIYTAFLTPKGKYLFDFFVGRQEKGFFIDIASLDENAFMKSLQMYRLRADVQIEKASLDVYMGINNMPDGAFSDPRHKALGWRYYHHQEQGKALGEIGEIDISDWDALRVAHIIPQTGVELISNSSYILEMGFERLNGVDFKKGCYVGQEITARMKHKTILRKMLVGVRIDATVPIGSDIISDGKIVGNIYTQSKNEALAYVRLDRLKGGALRCGNGVVTLRE